MRALRSFFAGTRRSKQEIHAAAIGSNEPRGGGEVAMLGAEIRHRVISMIEDVEAEINQIGIAVAEEEGILMIHPKLLEAIRKRPDRNSIEPYLGICFPTPATARRLNEEWQYTVLEHKSRPNTRGALIEKATVLTTFITNNLNITITEIRAHPDSYAFGMAPDQIDEKEPTVRVEEAACWYRIVDELAYRSLAMEDTHWFMGHFQDQLALTLALQGIAPELICRTMSDRTEEYSKYRKWVAAAEEGAAGTFLWEAAKHVGEPFGPSVSYNPIFLMTFSVRFLERLRRACIHELLSGRDCT